MMRKAETNFWLDAALFVALLLTTATGLALWRFLPHSPIASFAGLSRPVWLMVHGVAGALAAAGIVLHVVWHRDWLRALRGRPLREMSKKLRANRVVDRVMWLCFIAANICGALSAASHLYENSDAVRVPERLHVAFGVAWTVLTIVHLGLHAKWIAAMVRRCLSGGWQRAKALQQPGT